MFDFIGLGNGVINVVLLLVILVALVVIHEFGHFVVARRAGVTVHEFGIGFPPRAVTYYRDKKGTAYTLNWLPIGGFVRMEGEEGESEDPHSFVRQPLRTRMAILVAGVAMNILLAFIIFTGIALFADPVSIATIGAVTPGSPAASIGLVGGQQTGTDASGNAIYDDSGDKIIAINGERFYALDLLGAEDTPQGAYLRAHAGQSVSVTIRHSDGTMAIYNVTLRPSDQAQTQGALGVRFAALSTENSQRGLVDGVATGARRTADAATLILRGLGDLITNITNPPLAGPVGIVNTIGQVRSSLPPVFLIWFIGLLSANLAVVNALPFPPLDGGRIAVSLIQAATGNRIGVAAERLVYLAGFVLLMALLAWITYFDIQRLG